MELVGRLLGLLVLLLAGAGLRSAGLLDETRSARLNAVAYYVALPALIFVSTYDQALGRLLTPALLVGHVGVLLGVAGLAWVVHRDSASASRTRRFRSRRPRRTRWYRTPTTSVAPSRRRYSVAGTRNSSSQ